MHRPAQMCTKVDSPNLAVLLAVKTEDAGSAIQFGSESEPTKGHAPPFRGEPLQVP